MLPPKYGPVWVKGLFDITLCDNIITLHRFTFITGNHNTLYNCFKPSTVSMPVCVHLCIYVYMLPICLHYSCTLCECTMHIMCIILHNSSNVPSKIVYSMFFWPKYLTLYTLKAYTVNYLFLNYAKLL